jgi:cell division septation protein DedD
MPPPSRKTNLRAEQKTALTENPFVLAAESKSLPSRKNKPLSRKRDNHSLPDRTTKPEATSEPKNKTSSRQKNSLNRKPVCPVQKKQTAQPKSQPSPTSKPHKPNLRAETKTACSVSSFFVRLGGRRRHPGSPRNRAM